MVNQYDVVTDILATTEEFYAYYKEHEAEEDVIDYTYQFMQRTLYTKKWYRETKDCLQGYIDITQKYIPESKIFTDYYEYIIECLDKEAEKHGMQCTVQHYM
jgi:hypothetical protein